MELENKLSVSSDTELQVYLVDVPSLSAWVSFHFKGSSTAYWTYIEALSDDSASYPTRRASLRLFGYGILDASNGRRPESLCRSGR